MLDFEAATRALSEILEGVRDDQSTAPTPVASAAPLLDQLIGLTGRDPAWRSAAASGSETADAR